MSFSETGLMWPFYLFTFPPPPQPVPVRLHHRRSPIGRDGHTPVKHTKKPTVKQTLSNQHQWLFPAFLFSIDHLALSSINLQNALFKLLINTLIDLQKCHRTPRQEPLMVVSPQQSGSDECQNECVHYSLPSRADGFGLKCPSEQAKWW